MKHLSLIIHTDGGSRGNPGPAGIGVYIEMKEEGEKEKLQTLAAFGKTIGQATNNVAEYTAVIEALEYIGRLLTNTSTVELRDTTVDSLIFYLDSLLVVNQINGIYKMKNPDLRLLLFRIHELLTDLPPATFHAVRRELNTHADALVNQALDSAS